MSPILERVLKGSLRALNCHPVRFTDDPVECIVKDWPNGLDSNRSFDAILVNTELITSDILRTMRRLQPGAKIVFMVRSIDLAKVMRDLDINVRVLV